MCVCLYASHVTLLVLKGSSIGAAGFSMEDTGNWLLN